MVENDAVTTLITERAAVRRNSEGSRTARRRTRGTRGDTWVATLLISPAILAFTVFAIVTSTGDIFAGLWYPFVFTAISFFATLFFLPETRGRSLDF